MQVTVAVPQSRLAEFYEMYGRWLRGPAAVAPEDEDGDSTKPKPRGQMKRTWTQGTENDRLKDAKVLLQQLAGGTGGNILSFLLDHPGEWFSGHDLVRHLKLSGMNDIQGGIGAIGRRCTALGREKPEGFQRLVGFGFGASRYAIEPNVAELFRTARTELA